MSPLSIDEIIFEHELILGVREHRECITISETHECIVLEISMHERSTYLNVYDMARHWLCINLIRKTTDTSVCGALNRRTQSSSSALV